ncbi:MAG: winged helix-turn-helix domain-containing protein [Candidatus Omnitrophica bacterium]|nr:winged helix-turn-helix domain-containing protein [Candidatus Omnitrophota bacterium]
MIINIGIVAGEIWHYLDDHGKAKLSDLVMGLGKQQDIVLMSLGWLAREGHVLVEGKGDFEISLRDNKKADKQG